MGRDPYRELVPTLVQAWIDWAAEFIEGTPEQRNREAETAVALLDGLLLLRQLAGPEAGDRASGDHGTVLSPNRQRSMVPKLISPLDGRNASIGSRTSSM